MIFDRLEQSALRSDVSWSPLDDRFYSADPSVFSSFTGFPVTPESAKRASAVFGCNSCIAETVAGLGCHVMRRLDSDGRDRARDHPLYRTLRFQTNAARQTSPFEFFSDQQMHLGLRGNTYAEIRQSRDRIDLVPIHPTLVTVDTLFDGRLRYEVRDPKTGRTRTLLQDEMLHVRDLSDDGVVGQARAVLAREAIAVASAGEAYVGGFFRNDATGRLVMEHPGPAIPTKDKRDENAAAVREQYAGWGKTSRTMITYGGVKVKEIGKAGDGAFIVDPRKFQIADVARFWRVPLWMIGLEEKSTSWGSGIEQQFLAFVNLTIRAWTERWSQAIMLAFFDEEEQEEFFIDFNFKSLLKGDLKSRMEAYQIGRQIGMWSPNDLLAKEDESPRPGGDTYQETIQGAPPNPGDPDDADGPQAFTVPAPLIADAVNRIVAAEVRDVLERDPADPEKRAAWLPKAWAKRREYTVSVLTPFAESVGLPSWLVSAAADRIERTGLAATAERPGTWASRSAEVSAIIDETFRAGRGITERAA